MSTLWAYQDPQEARSLPSSQMLLHAIVARSSLQGTRFGEGQDASTSVREGRPRFGDQPLQKSEHIAEVAKASSLCVGQLNANTWDKHSGWG
jgi:hypothetical protein